MKKKKLKKQLSKIIHKFNNHLAVIDMAATSLQIQKEMDILDDNFFFDATDKILKNSEHLNEELKKIKI